MSESNKPFAVDTYDALWAESIASVLSQFTGANLRAEVGAPAENAFTEGRWVTFTLSGALTGGQGFWLSSADALHLAQSFMAETLAPEAEFSADHADALAELLRQFAGAVAVQLKPILGSECSIQFKDANAPTQSLQSGQAESLQISTEPAVTLVTWLDQALLNSITKAAASVAVSEADSAPVEETAAPEKLTSIASLNDKNLDLLLDLELDVSIRFGQRQMMLKDVLELGSGAVVELDRRTRDPIELMLGGRVIARGEAVVIDGNYGIRILEVISPVHALAQLA